MADLNQGNTDPTLEPAIGRQKAIQALKVPPCHPQMPQPARKTASHGERQAADDEGRRYTAVREGAAGEGEGELQDGADEHADGGAPGEGVAVVGGEEEGNGSGGQEQRDEPADDLVAPSAPGQAGTSD
ncbi:hypothetical protein ABT090_24705 [Streptomyces asoensis]|uniref:hypothetical protein n=1 Tax=Streptomyces asoensis TaxID=249586 RepID=UPI0033243665